MWNDKHKIKRNIRVVFFVYFTVLIMLVTHILKFYLLDTFELINKTLNPRVFIVKEDIVKGSILDKNDEVLAYSNDEERIYLNYPEYLSFAHILGFTTNGGLGLEANYSLLLQKLNNEFTDRLANVFSGEQLNGLNIKLTIDKEFQNYVYNELQKFEKGAIVAIEPTTGKILALASTPSFNPNVIDYNSDDTKYLNRVTQGVYPPGSVFKVVSGLTIINNVNNYDDEFYNCTGEITIEGETITCFNHNAHGKVNLSRAIEQSCNTYFAYYANEIGIQPLIQIAQNIGFNSVFKFDLITKISTVTNELDISTFEVMQTYIGQGNTLVTPLQMATLYSGIANGGVMMKPYVVEHTLSEKGNIIKKVKPEIMNKEISAKDAEQINNMLIKVVENGTAKKLSELNFKVAGKTGSAEASNNMTHGWFTGYAPADNPQIAIAIILEDSGGSFATMDTVKNIFNYYLE